MGGGEAEPRVIIVYDTMWESTGRMARAVLDGVSRLGVEARLFKMSVSDRNDIIKELLNAGAIVLGSPTINRDFLPDLAPLLEDLRGLKPRNRLGAAFGSYGWSKGAVKSIEERLSQAGINIIEPGLEVLWVPGEEELKQCLEFGSKIAATVKENFAIKTW